MLKRQMSDQHALADGLEGDHEPQPAKQVKQPGLRRQLSEPEIEPQGEQPEQSQKKAADRIKLPALPSAIRGTLKSSVTAARDDVRCGICASFDEALAVRLTLALGGIADDVLESITPASDQAQERLLMLIDP